MESPIPTSETYAGKKLTELLEFATSSLEPGPGFNIQLDGVSAIPVMHKELEAYFDVSLDNQAGASIILGFDDLAARMVLKEFSFPINGIKGLAKLVRTQTLGYIPVLEVRGKQIDAKQVAIPFEHGDVLLEGFNIEDFNLYGIEAYPEWKDLVVSKTSAWQVTEKVETTTSFDGKSEQSVTLSRSETIDLSKFKMIQQNSITRTIMLFNDDGTIDHTEMTLDSIKDLDRHDLPISVKTYRKKPDIFADGGMHTTRPRVQMLPINRDNFSDMKRALDEIIDLRRAA